MGSNLIVVVGQGLESDHLVLGLEVGRVEGEGHIDGAVGVLGNELGLGGDGVAVGIEQTAPLDGSAIGIQAQVPQNAKVFLVLGHKVIAGIRANAVVKRTQILDGPGVPQVLELAALVPLTLSLRAGHSSAKEEVVGQLILCHQSPRFRVLELPVGDGFALAGYPARARTGYTDIQPTKTKPAPNSQSCSALGFRLLLKL